jgi:hypothetical protein
VLDEDPVEEDLVAVLEAREADVLLERRRLGADVLELELDLLLDAEDAVGEEPVEAELPALLAGEGQPLVGGGVLEQPPSCGS